jgi:hypothetical protein
MDKRRALDVALSPIESAYWKGSVRQLGINESARLEMSKAIEPQAAFPRTGRQPGSESFPRDSITLIPGLHQLRDGFTREHVDLEFAAVQLFPKMLAQPLLVDLELIGDVGLADAKSRGVLNESALVIGRHIFGGHFPFHVAQLRDARALYGKLSLAIYIFDYGAPTGLRLALKYPAASRVFGSRMKS